MKKPIEQWTNLAPFNEIILSAALTIVDTLNESEDDLKDAQHDILELWVRVQELEKKLEAYGDSPQGAL